MEVYILAIENVDAETQAIPIRFETVGGAKELIARRMLEAAGVVHDTIGSVYTQVEGELLLASA